MTEMGMQPGSAFRSQCKLTASGFYAYICRQLLACAKTNMLDFTAKTF